MSTQPFQPGPCGGVGGPDYEHVILCDVDSDGNVLGSALAVYQYDSAGNPVGAPTFVNPATGQPYVVQGELMPCGEPSFDTEVLVLCDEQTDGSVVQFHRNIVYATDNGARLRHFDTLHDGSVYNPLGTVGSCDPGAFCTPSSTRGIEGRCNAPVTPTEATILSGGGSNDAQIQDDPTADPLCTGGAWAPAPTPIPAPFPINETFRTGSFNDPNIVTQGQAELTSGDEDPANQGWLRMNRTGYAENGFIQFGTPFSSTEDTITEFTWESHGGTEPSGDGFGIFFSDGSVPTQSAPIGGGGSLGLTNVQGGWFGVVFDEYGGAGLGSPFQANGIKLFDLVNDASFGTSSAAANPPGQAGRAGVAPRSLWRQAGRRNPAPRARISTINRGGTTFVTVSVTWDGGTEWVTYYDNVPVPAAATRPGTLRISLSGASGGSLRGFHDYRDMVTTPGGRQKWRAFSITHDPIPECATSVQVDASIDVTIVNDTSTTGNADPEVFFWLVNEATGEILERRELSSIRNRVGETQTLTIGREVTPALLPNLRVYVGAETRDQAGTYDYLFEDLDINVSALGCPADRVRTVPISAPCPIDVNIVGGGGGDAEPAAPAVFNAPSTFEDALICMTIADGSNVETIAGFRREVHNPDGSIDVLFLRESGLVAQNVDGWVPGPCNTARDTEVVVLCDFQLDGSSVPFIRRLVYDDGASIRDIVDTTLAGGTAYTPTGVVGQCGGAEQIDVEERVVCATYIGDPQVQRNVTRRVVFRDGIESEVTYYDQTGALGDPDFWIAGPCLPTGNDIEASLICVEGETWLHEITYTPGGVQTQRRWRDTTGNEQPEPAVWTFGECVDTSARENDVEVLVLCDLGRLRRPSASADTGPEPFQRTRIYNPDGTLLSTDDVTLDGTPYVPVGPVTSCDEYHATVHADYICVTDPAHVLFGQTLLKVHTDLYRGVDPIAGLTRHYVGGTNVPTSTVPADGQWIYGSCTDETQVLESLWCVNGEPLLREHTHHYRGVEAEPTFNTRWFRADETEVFPTPAQVAAATPGACPGVFQAQQTLRSRMRVVAPGSPWTPGEVVGRITALSATGGAGTFTVVDANGAASPNLPAGLTVDWDALDPNVLVPPQQIVAGVGSTVYVVWSEV